MSDRAPWGGAFRRHLTPSPGAAAALALLVLVALGSNGRPIGAGDTRPTERVAASLVGEGDFDLDEYPEVAPPFAREVEGRRVSIYPVLSALLAAPVFAAAGSLFALDETGTALAGKLAASLLSALAAAALFLAVGHRRPRPDAAATAVLFAVGTGVWATSQALWQHPAAVLFLALALLALVRAEDDDPVWAGRAGLPLALAAAARHAAAPMVAVLALGIAVRWPRRVPALALWSAPAVAFVLGYDALHFGSPFAHGLSGSLAERFGATPGLGHLGLLVSPGKGLLVFTPLVAVAAVGWVRALARPVDRPLAVLLGAAVLVHWLVMGLWTEWHGGWCWGPRLMTETLPLLFFYLPDGMERCGRWGVAAAVVSVAVQALGAFSYDYRWERLHERRGDDPAAALWRVTDNPILFHARERVVILAAPGVEEGHAFVRRHPLVLLGAAGSALAFAGDALAVEGAPALLGDVHLQRAARVEGDRLLLRGHWSALFLRVRPPGRGAPMELRVRGRGRGTLYVGETSFWRRTPRWREYPMAGGFEIRHPWDYATSGGPDLLVSLGRGGGTADLERVELVPAGR